MSSSDDALDGSPALLIAKVNDTSGLIQEAQDLLESLNNLDGKPADTGWELVAQLHEVLDRMRQIWPPRTFMPPGGNPETPFKMK